MVSELGSVFMRDKVNHRKKEVVLVLLGSSTVVHCYSR